jgi:hypothetical protein
MVQNRLKERHKRPQRLNTEDAWLSLAASRWRGKLKNVLFYATD